MRAVCVSKSNTSNLRHDKEGGVSQKAMTSSMGKNKECSVVGRVNHMKSTTVNASWARGNDSLWQDPS
eukprot:scaffold133460_cov20-Tisochrysis_lutea.AAC.3